MAPVILALAAVAIVAHLAALGHPSNAPCPHGMGRAGSCIDCMDEIGLGPAPAPLEVAASDPLIAHHSGTCGICHRSIVPDVDEIVRTIEERWVHARCVA